MNNNSTLYGGLDVHKESITIAYAGYPVYYSCRANFWTGRSDAFRTPTATDGMVWHYAVRVLTRWKHNQNR
ncbi:hypothetical protein D3C87_1234720 [compost metagenome]